VGGQPSQPRQPQVPIQPQQPQQPKQPKEPKENVANLMPILTPGAQNPPPSRPLVECMEERWSKEAEAAGDGREPMKWKPITETSKAPKKKKGTDWGASAMLTPPMVIQQAEWELWRLTTHCGDLNTPNEVLYEELEGLIALRARMMEMSGMASPKHIVHTVATALAESGLHMAIADLVALPAVAAVAGRLDMPGFLAKHPELFTVLDDPNTPGAKTVTLTGEVPPAPEPEPAGEEPLAKRPRIEIPSTAHAAQAAQVAQAAQTAYDPEKAAEAVTKIGDRVAEMLAEAEGNRLKLDELALDETIKELRKGISKTKNKMGQIIKDAGRFELKQAPIAEGAQQTCNWVSMVFS